MFRKSLGRRITALFLMVGLLPLLILAIFFYVQMRYSLREAVENNLITLASQVGIEVERTIFTAYTNIKALANNPILRLEGATKQEKLAEMQKIQDFYKIFEDITLIDLEGNVVISTTYNYRGAWKVKTWYKEAKEGNVVVSDVHILQSPYKIVMVTTAPVLDKDGRIMAVVAGQVNMVKIWEITDKVKLGKTGFVFLVNKEGDLIAYPDREIILNRFPSSLVLNRMSRNQSGSIEYRHRDLGSQICGFVRLKGYLDYKGKNWRIGLTQDSKEAFEVIRTTQVTLFSTALIFFVIIIPVSIGLTGDIIRPVRALVAGTKKIAEGDLAFQIKVLSEDEIGKLAGAFNLMAKELKKSMEEIVEKERLAKELKLGREIQMALLPQQIPVVPGLIVQGFMHPAKEIGGDYYDFIVLPDKNQFSVVIGDVSGKGVAAGLLMAMAKTAIHTLSQEETSPKKILLRANQILVENVSGQKFMTMLYFRYESVSRILTYSSAGHEHILIYRSEGRVESILSGGIMLGVVPDITVFLEDKTIQLTPGDKVILYTDGVTEARNPKEERFGFERLIQTIQRYGSKSTGQLLETIKGEVYNFIGTRDQYDDITIVIMEAA